MFIVRLRGYTINKVRVSTSEDHLKACFERKLDFRKWDVSVSQLSVNYNIIFYLSVEEQCVRCADERQRCAW